MARVPRERRIPTLEESELCPLVAEPLAIFHVPGRPIPKGDRRAIYLPERGHTVQFDKNPNLKPWQALIALFAKQAWGDARALNGPVSLELAFVDDIPKSRPKTRRSLPTTRPDVDKLSRAVLDGLMSVVFIDDSQVVRLVATKEYAYDRDPGVYITVSEVSDARPTPYSLEKARRAGARGAEEGLKHMAKKAKGAKKAKVKGKSAKKAKPAKARPVKRSKPKASPKKARPEVAPAPAEVPEVETVSPSAPAPAAESPPAETQGEPPKEVQ